MEFLYSGQCSRVRCELKCQGERAMLSAFLDALQHREWIALRLFKNPNCARANNFLFFSAKFDIRLRKKKRKKRRGGTDLMFDPKYSPLLFFATGF